MRVCFKKLGSILGAGILCVSLAGLGACAQTQAVEEEKPEEVSEVLRTIGDETDTAVMLEVSNGTTQDIVSFAIKGPADEDFRKSVITKSTKIEADETVIMYLETEDAAKEAESDSATTGSGSADSGTSDSDTAATSGSEDSDAPDVILRTLFSISLTFADDTTAVLHDVNINELSDMTIRVTNDGLAYIEYTNAEGKTESTLETEKALKEAAEAAEAERLAAEAEAAEAEAAAAEAAAASNAQQYADNSTSSNGYSYDTGSSSSTGSQNSDVCVEDPIFNY